MPATLIMYVIISYENVFAFDLHRNSGDKAMTVTLTSQHKLKNGLMPLEHQFHTGLLSGKCQGPSQTQCSLQPEILPLWEEVKTHLLGLLLVSIFLKNKMCFFRAQCDHSQEFLAKIFIITICSGLLMGEGDGEAWHPSVMHGEHEGRVRGGVSKASLEAKTSREQLEVTLNREKDCWSPGTWEKSNTGASRQNNLEVLGKKNRKWHLIQENVSDLDNKIKLACTACWECRVLKKGDFGKY